MTRSSRLAGAALAAAGVLQSPSAGARQATAGIEAVARRMVRADDPRFRYEGRFDLSDAAAPAVIWQASRISLDFEGDVLTLVFGEATGQSYFDVAIDDIRFVVGVRREGERRFGAPASLGPGRHRLSLFKRSEASAGHVRFEGVEVARSAQAWAPPAPAYRLALEFFGDSITAGACDEDGEADQWEDRSTHNSARSYAALAAAALGADHRSTSVSGMGISEGFSDVRAGEVWDRLYPSVDAPPADLRSWRPDIALVNLGENDASFTRARGRPFPSDFAERCVALVRAIRRAYPEAHVVLLRGGMENGARNADLRKSWEGAVAALEAADPAIHHFVFQHWSSKHPRVADHEAMAEELVAWLESQPFLLEADRKRALLDPAAREDKDREARARLPGRGGRMPRSLGAMEAVPATAP